MAARKRRTTKKKEDTHINGQNGLSNTKTKTSNKSKPKKTVDMILLTTILLLITMPMTFSYYKNQDSAKKSSEIPSNYTLLTNYTVPENKMVINDVENFTLWYLDSFICTKAEGGFCHDKLEALPKKRTHVATEDISENETLLVLPREYIITDLDAMNDPYIQSEFFSDDENNIVKHRLTNNPLDAGAYLAVHLLVRRMRQQNNKNETTSKDPMMPFFMMLPDEYQLQNHPVFWEKEDILNLLGNNTLVSQTVVAFRDMMVGLIVFLWIYTYLC